MKVYIAGPMQGYPEFNFPKFREATKVLRSQGHEVFSPEERDTKVHGKDIGFGNVMGDIRQAAYEHGFSLREALADDTRYICLEAEAIAMLPGWENSKGAFAEWALARALGLKVMYLT